MGIRQIIRWVVCGVIIMVTVVGYPEFITESPRTLESYSSFASRKFVPPLKSFAHKNDIRCLTEAVYYEAANQSKLGKEAVALVIVNRVYNTKYPSSVCSVIAQSKVIQKKRVCQFSYRCNSSRIKKVRDAWKEAEEISTRVYHNQWTRELLNSSVKRAIYYHADNVQPYWSSKKVFVGKIGNHLFYSETHLT